MVLVEESELRQVFRFRNKRWGVATLVAGLVLIASLGWLQATHKAGFLQSAIFYGFGVLLLYSSLYSLRADQWLIVDGNRRSIHFHKSNLYGLVDWERPGLDFKEIRVFRAATSRGTGRAKNWTIMLASGDGVNLFLGENEFGAFSRERALQLAGKVGQLAGITVVIRE